MALLVGHWTCNLHVLGSSPDQAPSHTGLGQSTYTCVPLSRSSIIWYWPKIWHYLPFYLILNMNNGHRDIATSVALSYTVVGSFMSTQCLQHTWPLKEYLVAACW